MNDFTMNISIIKKAFITVYERSTTKNGLIDHKTSWRKKYLKQKGIIYIIKDSHGRYFRWYPIDENNIVNYKKGMLSSNDDYSIEKNKLRIETLNSIYYFSIIREISLFDLPPSVSENILNIGGII